MDNANNGRMLEIATVWLGEWYWLYVKDKKTIRVNYEDSTSSHTIYPENSDFNEVCEKVIKYLYYNKSAKALKDLYDALEEGKLKASVKTCIDELIALYEKELKILKS